MSSSQSVGDPVRSKTTATHCDPYLFQGVNVKELALDAVQPAAQFMHDTTRSVDY